MINIAFLNHLAVPRSAVNFERTAAGLAALQIYDGVKTNGFDTFFHQDALDRIQRDVSRIAADCSIRGALDSVVQALPFWEATGPIRIGRQAVYTALMIYGQALGDEGEWHIAESVYALVGMDAELDGETWLAAEARLLMGRASRMCADWEGSRIAYRRAYELGMDCGDISIALRAQIGEANNLWSRGDFPAAKNRLATIARRAKTSCPALLPRVTLAIAGVANASGEYERAIHLAFGLLGSLSDDNELKYQTLVDLASFLADYGLPPIAATALSLVERAAPEPRVRRQAKLNLFFLAAQHDDESVFNTRRTDLCNEPLTPRQQTQFSLFTAQGFRRFSRFDAAQSSANHALQLANQFELFQLRFEAESELHAIDSARSNFNKIDAVIDGTGTRARTIHYRSTTGAKLSPRIRRIAESLENMASHYGTRESAISTAL